MFINADGELYVGDCAVGDREATQAEVASWQAAKMSAVLRQSAADELALTDRVAWRCFKAGITFPTDWKTHADKCRAICNGADTTATTLPARPAYPAGT